LASTAVVEFATTLCSDIVVVGYVSNGTAATKIVIDTITGSLWIADILEGTTDSRLLGGSGAALAVASSNSAPVAAVSAIKALPASTTATVATVTGGPVLVEYLAAEVTTIVQAQANATKFTHTDTASSTAVDLCATGDINAKAVGSFLFPKLDAAATALQMVAGAHGFALSASGIVLPTGTLVINCAATNTGNVKYHVRWRALQPGASLTLA